MHPGHFLCTWSRSLWPLYTFVRSRPREDEEQLTLKCIMMPLILQTGKIGRRPGRQALKVKPEKLFPGSGAKAKRLILRGAAAVAVVLVCGHTFEKSNAP